MTCELASDKGIKWAVGFSFEGVVVVEKGRIKYFDVLCFEAICYYLDGA